MDTPSSSSKMIGMGSYVMCFIVFLCFVPSSAHAKPLARPQRQALAGEVATGLTGTGMTFNPLYEGQNAVDSYYGYQQYDVSTPLNGGRNNRAQSGAYGGYGGYGGYEGNGINGGYEDNYGAKGGAGGGYGYGSGYSGYQPGYGNEGRVWQGFGGGKYSAQGGRQTPYSQYGLKY